MKISKDTEEILKFLDYITSNNLRKRNDLAVILELAATYNEISLLNDILFSATALWKIYKTIKNADLDADGIEKLKTESIKQADSLKSNIVLLLGDEFPEINKRFEDIYLQNTTGAFYNLIDLSHDLAELKRIQMDKKIQ